MKRSEPATTPELPPSLATLPTRKSRKRLIIAVVLIVIVLGVIISTYVIADTNVTSAVNSWTATAGDYRVTGMTTLPPSVDMEADLIIRNPSNINLHLNKLQADIFIDYAGTTHPLGSIDVSDKSLPANGYVSIPISMHAGTDVVNLITAHPSGYDIVVSVTLRVTGTWLFWTITKEDTANVREPVEPPRVQFLRMEYWNLSGPYSYWYGVYGHWNVSKIQTEPINDKLLSTLGGATSISVFTVIVNPFQNQGYDLVVDLRVDRKLSVVEIETVRVLIQEYLARP